MGYDQSAKNDEGKIRPTLVSTDAIRDIAKLEEFDEDSENGNRPRFISKTNCIKGSWKGLFECQYCGRYFEAYIGNVMSGKQRSCGCAKGKLMLESKGTHGDSKTRLYRTYRHILERCNSPACREYKYYGARGIKCEFNSYEDFKAFAEENGYDDSLTVERIDVNGNYSRSNITFIPYELQNRNKRNSVMLTYKGLTLCASEWACILGIHPDTLTKRKRSGWSDERALETTVGDSIDITLIPIGVINAIRQTRLYGIKKYPNGGINNWKQVEPERYRDAAFRHLLAYLDDPYGIDDESNLPHLWHLITNIAFLCELEDEHMKKVVTCDSCPVKDLNAYWCSWHDRECKYYREVSNGNNTESGRIEQEVARIQSEEHRRMS